MRESMKEYAGRNVMRTERILSAMERKDRKKKREKLLFHILQCVLRFLVQVTGTAVFTVLVVALMEYRPYRTVAICEILVCMTFSLWLGDKIYNSKRKKERRNENGTERGL